MNFVIDPSCEFVVLTGERAGAFWITYDGKDTLDYKISILRGLFLLDMIQICHSLGWVLNDQEKGVDASGETRSSAST